MIFSVSSASAASVSGVNKLTESAALALLIWNGRLALEAIFGDENMLQLNPARMV